MTSASLTLKTFGIPMQRRAARRRLVVVTYIVLAAICCFTAWFARTYTWSYGFALYAAVAVGIFVFGGQGRFGLIKAFPNKQPRPEPPIVDLVRLHLAPESIPAADSAGLKNDERELSRRDRAHYLAFQPLSVVWFLALLLAAWALHPPSWLPLNAILSLLFVLALVASILTITLPAAIILWNEPDMESPTFSEGARS